MQLHYKNMEKIQTPNYLDDNVINIMKIEKIWNHLGDKSCVSFPYVQLWCLPTFSYCSLCKSNIITHSLCIMVMQSDFFSLSSAYHHYVQLMNSNVSWTPSVFRSWEFLWICLGISELTSSSLYLSFMFISHMFCQ